MYPEPVVNLPDELWRLIMRLLDAPDLRRCQLVCRLFCRLTMDSYVRFRMELDAAGYAEPTNPRPGLSINQRLSTLREHMSRRQSLIPCRMDTLWEGFSESLIEDSSPQLVGCVFAYLDGNGLRVVELPSPNKGTALSRRTIPKKRLCGDNQVHQAWVYPSRDLLVWCYEVLVNGGVEEYTFYLQTLSTNEVHPDAFDPVIHLDFHMLTDIFVRLQGVMMLVEISRISRVIVWDWTSGKIIFDITGISMTDVLLLDTLLLVVRPNKDGFASTPCFHIGTVEVYSVCPIKDSMTCVARMELPRVNWDDMLLRLSTMFPNGTHPNPGGIRLSLSTNPVYDSVMISQPSRRRSGVFEVPDSKSFIRVTVRLSIYATSFSPHYYLLLIPTSTILRTVPHNVTTVNSMKPSASPQVIPWSNWGSEARWIHYPGTPEIEPFFSGQRGVLCTYNPKVHSHPYDGISVVELHPGFHAYCQSYPSQAEANADTTSPWTYGSIHPTMGANMMERWLENISPDSLNLQSSYFMAKLKPEIIDKLDLRLPSIVNWIDDEHLIVMERNPEFYDRIKRVVVFTF